MDGTTGRIDGEALTKELETGIYWLLESKAPTITSLRRNGQGRWKLKRVKRLILKWATTMRMKFREERPTKMGHLYQALMWIIL